MPVKPSAISALFLFFPWPNDSTSTIWLTPVALLHGPIQLIDRSISYSPSFSPLLSSSTLSEDISRRYQLHASSSAPLTTCSPVSLSSVATTHAFKMPAKSRFTRLDAFTKTVEDARIRTTSGGIVTIVSLIVVLYLAWGEWADYRRTVIHPELIVDKGRGKRGAAQAADAV